MLSQKFEPQKEMMMAQKCPPRTISLLSNKAKL